jgi:predicted  nucleic acid-binding Zn-ribbon protein
MSQSVTDDRFLQCTQCGKIYVGQQKPDGCVVPRGTTACLHCGSNDLEAITQADLGLD